MEDQGDKRPGIAGKRLVTVKDLVEMYGFSTRFWYARKAEGMPHRRWSSRLRFDPDEVREWMDERERLRAEREE